MIFNRGERLLEPGLRELARRQLAKRYDAVSGEHHATDVAIVATLLEQIEKSVVVEDRGGRSRRSP